jgi:oligosaccharide repeat unit polymerase
MTARELDASRPAAASAPGARRPSGPVAPDPAAFGAIALRTMAAVGVGALMLADHVSSLSLVMLIVLSILAVDARNPFSLRNFLLVYSVFVFGVGGGVLHLTARPIYRDIAAYVAAFLAGYALASMPAALRRDRVDRSRFPEGRGPLSLLGLEYALVALIAINLMFLAFQFLKYGVVGYYQGQGLLDQALTYGKASAAGGLEQIVRFALSDGGIAIVVLYVRASFESSTPIRYRYPAALFVALPILSLSRFNAVVGSLTLLAIYACDRRLNARVESPARAPRKVNRGAVIVLGLVLAVASAAFVASLRGGFANKSGAVGSAPDAVAMFTSELSPVQAYGDIKANIGILGHPHGRTIILPLLLKVVPRAWYPDKPLNSGSYYMSTVRPGEWAAGYALPPTFFGDAYLSFGFGGALLASMLLGLVAARLDLAYKRAIRSRLPWFLLIFANFFALLRDPLSESLAGIALTLLVWAVGNHLFRTGRSAVVDRPTPV